MSTRLTKNEWISRCRIHHGNKFDYSKSDFSGMKGRITIHCPEHGYVSVNVRTHALGGDCKRCLHMPEKGKSLGDLFPQSIIEWHPSNNLSPHDFTVSTHKCVKWICSNCQHEWTSRVQYRTRQRKDNSKGKLGACPACTGHEVHLDGRNSLLQNNPEIAVEFDLEKNKPLTPSNITHGTNKRVHWKCHKCNHEWMQNVSVRTHSGAACPACSNHELHIYGRNSLRNISPELSDYFHPIKNYPATPDNIVGSGDKKYWWIHDECGHEWFSAIKTQSAASIRSSSGCSYCNKGYLHSDGRNSLAITHPVLAKEWHPSKNNSKTPENTVAGTRVKLWWLCNDCNHEWEATGDKRSKLERGCPVCTKYSYGIHSDGRNSLVITHPKLANEWHPSKNLPLTPKQVRSGSSRRIYWICNECSWEWAQNINVRTSMKCGCPSCSDGGFKQDQPAYYYCFTLSGPEGIWWYKGGITDEPERRKKQIQRSLYKSTFPLEVEIIDLLYFDEGYKALELETKLLRCQEIRDSTVEKFSGSNELFSINPIEYARKKKWIEIE
jgi:hypothetical protein